MTMESQQHLDGARLLYDVTRETFGDTFKAYYIGTPDMIPEAALPCVIIQKISGQFESSATGTDDRTEQVLIQVFASGKSGFGAPDSSDTVMQQLIDRIEAIDANGNFKTTSFMSMLRRHLTLNDSVINNDVVINYDIEQSPDQPNIYEAIITVTLYRRVYITDRD